MRGDFLHSPEREFFDFTKIRTSALERSGDMKMQVADGLSSGDAVILPHSNSWPLVGRIDSGGGVTNGQHQRFGDIGFQVQQGLNVRLGHH
jgi:hypothetical protein